MAGNPILSNGSLHAKINQLELVIKHLAAAHQADLMKLHQAMEACRNWQVSFITLNEQFDQVNVNLADAEARIRNAEENARQSANEAQRLMAVLNHIVHSEPRVNRSSPVDSERWGKECDDNGEGDVYTEPYSPSSSH